MKKTTQQSFCNRSLLRLFTFICTTLVSTLSFGQAGNAPMQSLPNFPGPMAIDGFTRRQTAAAGDWFAGPGLTNNIVFTDNCVPLVPLAYHLVDLWNDQVNDDIFDGGNKLFQDPNTWGWRSQKPPAKDNNSCSYNYDADYEGLTRNIFKKTFGNSRKQFTLVHALHCSYLQFLLITINFFSSSY